ncbi:hypothetical protein BGZ95_002969 [Linnemannia exigua]|uniref:Uncharacterized protein n=1 Tax=Linnemannia exigua TaxID=604196 RepID=A0AAD4D6K4_9FUNG|nr:hypothetical protein BGZ95_002969 [Linnemannia exigua]
MKLIVSLTITLGLMATAATAVSVAEAAPAVAAAAAAVPEAVAQEDTFYSNQSPPIWNNARPNDNRPLPDDSDLPIQFRHGSARGGWGHGHDRDRIGSGGVSSIRFINNRKMKKRAVVFDANAHLSLNQEFGDITTVNDQVATEVESAASSEAYPKVKCVFKRDVEEEEVEEEEGAEAEEEEEEAEEEEDAEAEEDEEDVEVDIEGYQSSDFQFSEFMEDNQAEDEEADEDEEEDEEEEARLDSEAGLEDWIEEMKSEEYFNLAGHPTGEPYEEYEEEEGEMIAYDENEEEVEGENSFNEDEPSPSEEELFAASWHH